MIKLPPDWTFAVQVIAFVVFWQLMRWAVFVPAQRALKARAERTTGDRARAESLRAEAATIVGNVEAQLAEARQEGMRAADGIRRAAETNEQTILGRYRDQALALLERERAATATQVAAARAPLQADAEHLAGSVVAKVLGRPA
ncbi:MAG TPA: ATP synthase F0 subunit B [Candidatus Binatia bacterium]|jgi:F0F1-type ATP synthase membrane subunit b/b'